MWWLGGVMFVKEVESEANDACFFFQAEDGILGPVWSRGLGDGYKKQS
mgnify:CR=1 FL=1